MYVCVFLCLSIIFCRIFQQRMSYDLLSSLSNVLLDGTIFEIVNSLKEVQQLEERNLSNQRIKFINEQKGFSDFVLK